jgi:hypothetical protein
LQPILCGATDRRAGRLLATFETFIQGAAHQAGLGGFGVADKARIVNLVAAQTEIGHGDDRVVAANTIWATGLRFNVGVTNLEIPTTAVSSDITTLLRRIIFVGETPLGSGFNFEGISLRAVSSSHEIIMGGFCVFEPRGPFGDIIGQTGGFTGLEYLSGCFGAG